MSEWWEEELKEPCVALKLKLKTPAEILGGDARIAIDTTHHAASSSTTGPSMPPPILDEAGWSKVRRGGDKKIRVAALGADGLYSTNNAGKQLCRAYSRGECSGNGPCKRNAGAHQCARCLRSDHGAHEVDRCPKFAGSDPYWHSPPVKGGKGFGKGGKHKGGQLWSKGGGKQWHRG